MNTAIQKRSIIILIAGVIVAILYYPLVGQLLFAGSGYTVVRFFYSRLLIWLEVIGLYLYATRVEKNKFLLWSEMKYQPGFYFASFGALYLLALGASIASKIPALFGLHDNRRLMLYMISVINQNTLLMFFGALTAGITEELIFRAYLVPRLELIFKNKYMPVIISALAFGLIHFRYQSYGEVIFAALFGVVFAIHYQWYRNIKILIVTHACIDLVSFSIFKLANAYHLHIK